MGARNNLFLALGVNKMKSIIILEERVIRMKPMLSICMMVKNEEKNLERCLKSLEPILNRVSSELIIVDTGSTDRTVEIANRYTDKVYFHPWNHNFSEMRNISIGYATGTWVFIVDADEEIDNYAGIVNFLTNPIDKKIGAATLMGKNLTNDSTDTFVALMTPRIFRRTSDFFYRGAVHNTPNCKGIVVDTGSSLIHYGYISTDKELMEKKFQRTSKLLQIELEKEPDHLYYRYQLAVTYSMHGDKEDALREIQRVYYKYQNDDKALTANAYVFGVFLQFSIVNGKLDDNVIEAGLHGIRIEPEYLDIYFYLAQIYALRKEYQNAYSYYEKYLNLVENFPRLNIRRNLTINHYTLRNQNEAFYNMAVICFTEKEYSRARKHAKILLDNSPSEEYLHKIYLLLIEIDFSEESFLECKKIYDRLLSEKKYVELKTFEIKAERHWKQLGAEGRLKYSSLFKDIPELYGSLNRLRLGKPYINEHELDNIVETLVGYDVNQFPNYYAFVFMVLMQNDDSQNLFKLSCQLSEGTILEYMKYLDEVDRSQFIDACKKKLAASDNKIDNQYQDVRIRKNIAKYLLFSGDLDENEYAAVLAQYLDAGKKYLRALYNEIIIQNELIYEMRNVEEVFLLYMVIAEQAKDDSKKVVQYLKKALNVYPDMSRGVESVLQSLSVPNNNKEMNQLTEELLLHVEKHIASNRFDEALAIIRECESIVGNNLRLLSMKAEIFKKKYNN
jgi:glycosyltransferase involved in cell wall biosynthesis